MNKEELPFIKDMFDSIAPKYDFLNRFLSMRQDVYWRRKMVGKLRTPKGATILDVACGTCDVCLEIIKQKGKDTKVFGADFSPGMLFLGKPKIEKSGNEKSIHLLAGNALELPFSDQCFDAITIAFGIRNIADKQRALKEFHKKLKKGGRLAILELTTPKKGFFLALYLFYFRKILPFIGQFFSKHSDAYSYLPESVLNFPDSETFAGIIESSGFENVTWKQMTLGIVTLYIGDKL